MALAGCTKRNALKKQGKATYAMTNLLIPVLAGQEAMLKGSYCLQQIKHASQSGGLLAPPNLFTLPPSVIALGK